MNDTTPTVIASVLSDTADFPIRNKWSADAQSQIDSTLARQAYYAKANQVAAEAWAGGA